MVEILDYDHTLSSIYIIKRVYVLNGNNRLDRIIVNIIITGERSRTSQRHIDNSHYVIFKSSGLDICYIQQSQQVFRERAEAI